MATIKVDVHDELLTNPVQFERGSILSVNQTYAVRREGRSRRYTVLEKIGEGGEAQLYLVSTDDNREAVLKLYDNYSPRDKEYHAEVLRNMFSLWGPSGTDGSFESHHLLPVPDFGELIIDEGTRRDGIYWTEVHPRTEAIRLDGWTYERLKGVIAQLLEAVNSLHSHLFIHRDIKPENLFVKDGNILLGDYGTVRIQEQGRPNHFTRKNVFSPGYTPISEAPSFAADYFSFGMTIATLSNGRHVFDALLKDNDDSRIGRV